MTTVLFFPFQMIDPLLSRPVTLDRTSSTILKNDNRGHFSLIPDLRGKPLRNIFW